MAITAESVNHTAEQLYGTEQGCSHHRRNVAHNGSVKSFTDPYPIRVLITPKGIMSQTKCNTRCQVAGQLQWSLKVALHLYRCDYKRT